MTTPALTDPASLQGLSPHALMASLGAQPLMIEEGFFNAWLAALVDRADDQREASSFVGAYDPKSRFNVTDDGTALIRVQGLLVNRGAWLGQIWGMTSYEGLAEQIKRCTADDSVRQIVFDIDSGGGMAAGIWDLMPTLDAAKAKKRVTAIANSFCASAAYAIGCAAHELYVNRSSMVGSIGVIQQHMDVSEALARAGMKPTTFKAGRMKGAGNSNEPLTAETRAYIQAGVDQAYEMFVGHVAGYRGLDASAVKATEARIYSPADAVSLGLADGVLSLDELLDQLRSASTPARKRAQSPGASRMTTNPGAAQLSEADLTKIIAGLQTPAAAATPAPVAAPAAAAAAQVDPAKIAADAVATDRKRFADILALESAKGREGLAQKLASAGMDVAAADDILKAAPVAAATGSSTLAAAMRLPGNSAQIRPEATSAANGGASAAASLPSFADRVKEKYAKPTSRRSA